MISLGLIIRSMTCDEAEEPPTTRAESVMKIECNITSTTNYLMQGLMNVSRIAIAVSPSLSYLGK